MLCASLECRSSLAGRDDWLAGAGSKDGKGQWSGGEFRGGSECGMHAPAKGQRDILPWRALYRRTNADRYTLARGPTTAGEMMTAAKMILLWFVYRFCESNGDMGVLG